MKAPWVLAVLLVAGSLACQRNPVAAPTLGPQVDLQLPAEVIVAPGVPGTDSVKAKVEKALFQIDDRWMAPAGTRSPALNVEVDTLDPSRRPHAFWPFGGPALLMAGGGTAMLESGSSGGLTSSLAVDAVGALLVGGGVALAVTGAIRAGRLHKLERRIGYRIPKFRVRVGLTWVGPDGVRHTWSMRYKATSFGDEYPLLPEGSAGEESRRDATIEAFARHLKGDILDQTGWTTGPSGP